MNVERCWVSHPQEWQPKLEQWAREFPGRLTLHGWPQFHAEGAGGEWVRGLTLTLEDEPGFWEAAGYHNYGDPWREQRYWSD